MGRIINRRDIRKGDVVRITRTLTATSAAPSPRYGRDATLLQTQEHPELNFHLFDDAEIELVERVVNIALPTDKGSVIELENRFGVGTWFLTNDPYAGRVWVSGIGNRRTAAEMEQKIRSFIQYPGNIWRVVR